MPRVRFTLALAGLLLAASCAGCLGGSDGPLNRDPPNGTATAVTADAGRLDASRGAQYLPDEGVVRYVASRSGGEPTSYSTVSLRDYALPKCAPAAADRVRAVVESRIDPDDGAYDVGGLHGTHLDVTVWASSDLEPSVVRPHVPPVVRVTATLFDRTVTCRLPVVVHEESEPVPQ